jgi:hypothetical protein
MNIDCDLANVRDGAAFHCLETIDQAISYSMNTQRQAPHRVVRTLSEFQVAK